MTQLAVAFYQALTPPPNLTVSQWADRFRMLSPEASAEPGRWRTDRAPHTRAIMDALTDPTVYEIVFMKSSQVAGTEVLLNTIGYAMDLDPGPMLLIQPTLDMAEAFSKDRLAPMLRDTPVLKSRVTLNRRDASNTLLHKTFPGGHLTLAGSNSAAGLASRPIRYVLADELDRWEKSAGKEGDPFKLAWKRATTFWNRKGISVSSPGIKGQSRIEAKYEESDQRKCFLACPHCATRHTLQWKNVKWKNDEPESAHLVCPECGCEIDEEQRQAMLADPEWRATAPFHGTAGFFIWEAYSPWRRLADIVADFLVAKKEPSTLQVFTNTSLAETWEVKAEPADTSLLITRREVYAAAVPMGACYLTAGVDTQDDRLEVLVLGWGPGEECWVIDHRTISGDPQRPEPWSELDTILTAGYLHETGAVLHINGTCIDSAGHRTSFVYDYCKTRRHQNIYCIIGRDGANRPIVSAPSDKRSGKEARPVPLFTIGVDMCKSLIHSRLKITEKGTGYIHLPLEHQVDGETRFGVDEEFIAQLLAEVPVTKHKNGVAFTVWTKMRPRNEASDLMNYALGALRMRRPDLAACASALNPSRPAPPPAPVAPAKPRWIPKRSGFLRGRR